MNDAVINIVSLADYTKKEIELGSRVTYITFKKDNVYINVIEAPSDIHRILYVTQNDAEHIFRKFFE